MLSSTPKCLMVAVIVFSLSLMPALASFIYLVSGEVETSGEEPMLTKTGTLTLDNREPFPLEDAQAVLAESDAYSIVDGVVDFPTVGAGTSVESADTYAIEIDVSAESSPSVILSWSLQYDLDGDHHEVEVTTVMHVAEYGE